MVNFNEDAIREAAYFNWQNAGCPQGKDEYFWAMAVEQFSKCTKSSCCTKKAAAKKTATKSACKATASKTATATKKKTVAKK
ncbi:MAG: DUF2934 domain-containing protein [Alphaproteobacteria bacterium]|jgi:hypothetical protein|nr:DUF2934 domain-containing protein [Alphaproteobacteria bacterium]